MSSDLIRQKPCEKTRDIEKGARLKIDRLVLLLRILSIFIKGNSKHRVVLKKNHRHKTTASVFDFHGFCGELTFIQLPIN